MKALEIFRVLHVYPYLKKLDESVVHHPRIASDTDHIDSGRGGESEHFELLDEDSPQGMGGAGSIIVIPVTDQPVDAIE